VVNSDQPATIWPLMMVIHTSGKACCILLVLFHTSLSAGDFRTWKELRDTGIEKQNLDVSCGAAAAATILRAYYGVAVSEQEILAEVIKAGLDVTASDLERDLMTEMILTALSGAETIEDLKKTLLTRLLHDKELFFKLTRAQRNSDMDLAAQLAQAKLDGTASFADLKKALPTFGFTAHGLSLSFKQLLTIRIPVIVHLRPQGRDHLSVLRGIDRETGLVLLGDPSWGNRKVTAHRFQAIWDGKILFILPKDDARNVNVERGFFHAPKPNTLATQHLMLRSDPLLDSRKP